MTATEHLGEHGTAVLLTVPQNDPRSAATLDYWLLTAPGYAPWSQYILACVQLVDVPGYPPLRRGFPGATHEVAVAALSPLFGRLDADTADRLMADCGLPVLRPVNVIQHFKASDDEMRQVCELAAVAVCGGALNPETDDDPDGVREAWLAFVVRALAGLRGEDHAP